MALTLSPIDGNNVSVEISLPDTTLDVLTINMATGAVSGAFLPDTWLPILQQRALLFFTAIDLADRSAGALNFMQRLVNVSPFDDSTLSLSSVPVGGDVYTLRVTVAGGAAPAHVIIDMPHSISGAVAVVGGVTGAGSGVVTLSGDVIGLSNANSIAAGVVTDAKVAAANKDGLAATPSMRTLGTTAQVACAGNDPRLSDSRAPTGASGGVLAYPGSTYPAPTGLAAIANVIPIASPGAGTTVTVRPDVVSPGAGVTLAFNGGQGSTTGGAASLTSGVGATGGAASVTGAAGSAGAGGAASVTAGQGSTNGGVAAVLAGRGLAGSGGAATLIAGQGSTAGGAATVSGGAGGSTGGAVSVTGGASTGAFAAGSVVITGGSNSSFSGVMGAVTITGGGNTISSTINGGSASLTGGGSRDSLAGAANVDGGDSVNGTGGAISLTAGDSTSPVSAGNGGPATFRAGNAVGGGNGGALDVTGGASATGIAGTVTVRAGTASGAGTHGAVAVVGGGSTAQTAIGGAASVTGGGSSGGAGGAASLVGGGTVFATGVGGAASVTGGASNNGTGGAATITGGAATTGTGGDVNINAGAGTVASGAVNIGTLTPGGVVLGSPGRVTSVVGRFAFQSSGTTAVLAATALVFNRSLIELTAVAPVVFAGTIAPGNNGQIVVLFNQGANAITFQNGTPANLKITSPSVILDQYETLTLIYVTSAALWVEMSKRIA